mmetsp:Transcript_34790/g.92315  ORF Transcript_34790/g.92315 Transcript_34790/m.92315 type:complete len:271 (-) Transcript_34790:550-1362(-)
MPLEKMGLETFDLERPEWAKAICGVRRPREGDDAEDRSQRQRGEDSQGGRGKKEQELVDLTAWIALVNARGLALVEPNVMETYLLDTARLLAKAGLAANKYYTEVAAGLEETKKANPETDLSSLGQSFVTVFWLTMNAVRKQDQGAVVDVVTIVWDAQVDKKQPDCIATDITHFSVKQPRGDHCKRMVGESEVPDCDPSDGRGYDPPPDFRQSVGGGGGSPSGGSGNEGAAGEADRRAAPEEEVIPQRRQRAKKDPIRRNLMIGVELDKL